MKKRKEREQKAELESRKTTLKNQIKTTINSSEKNPENEKNSLEDNELLQSLLIQKKRKIALDPALFKRLLAEENEENRALLDGLRKKRNKKTGKMELFWENKGNSGSSGSESQEFSETDSEEYLNEDEKFS